MTARVCLVVLNWNGWRDTLACLESALPLLRPQHCLVVCDNASSDDSWEQLQAWAATRWAAAAYSVVDLQTGSAPAAGPLTPGVLLRSADNRGFAAGHNTALRYVLAHAEFDYFWLLNNDLLLAPDSLDALLRCASDRPNVGVFGSTVLNQPDNGKIQCAGGCAYYPWLTLLRNNRGGWDTRRALAAADPQRLDYVYGAALLLRAECLRRVGLLEEGYFLFYEELDYCQRLRRAGYALAWCRDSRVYHRGSASIGAHGDDRAKLRRAQYYENLNSLRYTARFHPRRLWFAAPFRFAAKLLALGLRRQWFLLAPLWRAYRDFFARPEF